MFSLQINYQTKIKINLRDHGNRKKKALTANGQMPQYVQYKTDEQQLKFI